MNEALKRRIAKSLDDLGGALPSRGRVLVMPHDHPDPDALASAAGLQLLLQKRYGLQGVILFTGTTDRAENQEMMRHFRYRWTSPGKVKTPRRPMPAVFVDTAPWSGNVTVPGFAKPVAVVDHHPTRGRKNKEGLFADIRSGAGATATMVYQYLKGAEIQPPRWLATLITYAILTETLDLSRDCTEEDLNAYTAMLARANLRTLGRIRHAPLTREYFAHLSEATREAQVFGRVAFTHLHEVSQSAIVAEVADLLLRLERITWSFCTAWQKDRLLVSMRSASAGADCGRVLRKAIGSRGSGGGHRQMAAGYLNVKGLNPAARSALHQEFVAGLLKVIERRSRRKGRGEEKPLSTQPLVS
jgi:nanoRNase/pAp phosphatase (c-di-AMP/oligoRNAs hydrolase)